MARASSATGPGRRVRGVAVWSLALFMASVPAAMFGSAIAGDSADVTMIGGLLGLAFWIVALAVGLWATFLAFRHWEALTVGVRWLALSPVAIVSVLMLLSVLAATFV